jgi:hypothetical protein
VPFDAVLAGNFRTNNCIVSDVWAEFTSNGTLSLVQSVPFKVDVDGASGHGSKISFSDDREGDDDIRTNPTAAQNQVKYLIKRMTTRSLFIQCASLTDTL